MALKLSNLKLGDRLRIYDIPPNCTWVEKGVITSIVEGRIAVKTIEEGNTSRAKPDKNTIIYLAKQDFSGEYKGTVKRLVKVKRKVTKLQKEERDIKTMGYRYSND